MAVVYRYYTIAIRQKPHSTAIIFLKLKVSIAHQESEKSDASNCESVRLFSSSALLGLTIKLFL